MDSGCYLRRGRAYAISHPEDDPNRVVIDERKICLGDILAVDLNFGDNWHHVVHVEEVLPLKQPNGAGYAEAGERTGNGWHEIPAVRRHADHGGNPAGRPHSGGIPALTGEESLA